MRSDSSPDFESFQKALADAFVVQESEIEARSLCAVVELQGLIATGELPLDQAMTLIADRACNVANATGIAIALLSGDQLTYRAGSGSSADRLGRHVTAVLSISRQNESMHEILRVEDAHADRGIEAAICRQFGAGALLILPIYDHRALVGVLEVTFRNAHEFHDREVRAYRLMASLVGDAVNRAAQLKKGDAAAEQPVIEQPAPQLLRSLDDGRPKSETTSHPANRQTFRARALASKFWTRRHLGRIGLIIEERARHVPLYKRWTVAAALALVSWIAYRDLPPASTRTASVTQESNRIERPLSSDSAKPSASPEARRPTASVPTEQARTTPRTTPRWVRVSSNELDYVAEDVTVRYFNRPPQQPRPQVSHAHVKTIGDDVTVRYFGSEPLAPTVQPGNTRIHYISEDGTMLPVRSK
jgi:hypothetical protein